MTTINLRDFYPWYTWDEFIDVSDAVAEELFADKRYHKAHRRRVYYNKAQYSLDAGDGIESAAVYRDLSPHEVTNLKLKDAGCAGRSIPCRRHRAGGLKRISFSA